MSDKPWREWSEYGVVQAFWRPGDPGRGLTIAPVTRGLDALCARVWREAQIEAAKADSHEQQKYDAERQRAEAAEQQAARLVAALRKLQPGYCDAYCIKPRDGEDFVHADECDTARAALADSPKGEHR